MSCAYRDGIVDSTEETVTQGQYGMPVLPLLSGIEKEGPVLSTYKYIKEGPLRQMHLGLLPMVGRKVKVLRGYGLKSRYAPRVGIRYDGE